MSVNEKKDGFKKVLIEAAVRSLYKLKLANATGRILHRNLVTVHEGLLEQHRSVPLPLVAGWVVSAERGPV